MPDQAPFIEFLRESCLAPEDVPDWSFLPDSSAVRHSLGRESQGWGAGVRIPYFFLDGSPVDDHGMHFARVRMLDEHDQVRGKYQSPPGADNHVYIPRRLRDVFRMFRRRNEYSALLILEGEKKAEAAVRFGLPAIGIAGVDCWAVPRTDKEKRTRQPKRPLPELAEIVRALAPSSVLVVFDSDGAPLPADFFRKNNFPRPEKIAVGQYVQNRNVHRAAGELADALMADLGVKAGAFFVPHGPVEAAKGEPKMRRRGLDDWIAEERYGEAAACPDPVWRDIMLAIRGVERTPPEQVEAAGARVRAAREEARAAEQGGYIPLGTVGGDGIAVWNRAVDAVICIKIAKITNVATLFSLCGAPFVLQREEWQTTDPEDGKNGIDVIAAAGEIVGHCCMLGPFDQDTATRGAGVWADPADPAALIVNSSDGVWRFPPGGEPEPLARCEAGRPHIYPRAAVAPRVLSREEIEANWPLVQQHDLFSALDSWSWKNQIDGALLAGWWASTAWLGRLDSRPGCFVTGESASGKTTLFNLLSEMLGGYRRHIEMASDSSQVGIRQLIGRDALPLVLDELEPGSGANQIARRRAEMVDGLFRMLRASYSAGGGERHGVVKGSAGGEAVEFSLRTAGLVGGVNVSQLEQADRNRMLVVELLPPKGRAAPPLPANPRLVGDLLRNLLWRAWPHFQRNLPGVTARVREALGRTDGRVPVTYGIVLAASAILGAACRGKSEAAEFDEYVERVVTRLTPMLAEHFNRGGEGGGTDQQVAFESLMAYSIVTEHFEIIDGTMRVVRETVSVSEAVDRAVQELAETNYAPSIVDEQRRPYLQALKKSGIIVRVDQDSAQKFVFVAYSHPGIKKIENALGITGIGRLVARLPQAVKPPGIENNRASFGTHIKAMRGAWIQLND